MQRIIASMTIEVRLYVSVPDPLLVHVPSTHEESVRISVPCLILVVGSHLLGVVEMVVQ